MQIGITKFPGTNNEQDVARIINELGMETVYIPHYESQLVSNMDAIVLAGGFSYGDYLRPGVIAAHSQLMNRIIEFARDGSVVIGICNGFQMLCETGLLPGVLLTNTSTKFISKWVNIRVNKTVSPLLKNLEGEVLKLPIAHYEGNYYDIQRNIESLKKNHQIVLQYCDEEGKIIPESNPNGSTLNIAGIVNKHGNILGMMPHPERASFNYLRGTDGRIIFSNLKETLKC